MTEAALVEGQVKLRDGKKVGARGGRGAGAGRGRPLTAPLSPQWKSRWLVLRKPSPVAGERGASRGRDECGVWRSGGTGAGGLLRRAGRSAARAPEIAGGAGAVTGERSGLGLRLPGRRDPPAGRAQGRRGGPKPGAGTPFAEGQLRLEGCEHRNLAHPPIPHRDQKVPPRCFWGVERCRHSLLE